MDALLAEAEARGIRVLLDLVPNHTSEQHPWFRGEHRDWYVWADPAPDGGPPNNWRSVFGGSAWEWSEPDGRFYLHNFLPSMPDLDWWNEGVRAEFEDILRFWFDRGVAGFRIDVAHGLVHDRQLRDNSPVRAGRLGDAAAHGPAARPQPEPAGGARRLPRAGAGSPTGTSRPARSSARRT